MGNGLFRSSVTGPVQSTVPGPAFGGGGALPPGQVTLRAVRLLRFPAGELACDKKFHPLSGATGIIPIN